MTVDHDTVKAHLAALYDELVAHEGYAELAVDIRILKRGQKEVVIRCGRQHRYVVDQATDAALDTHLAEQGARIHTRAASKETGLAP